MDDLDYCFPAAVRSSQRNGCEHTLATGSSSWDALLPGWCRRRPVALAASFLVVWSPGGVYTDLARLWHHLRGIAGLLAQTHFRLYLHCLVWCRHWLPELHGVGSPHVRGWSATRGAGILRYQHHTHSNSHSAEDIQLGLNGLRGENQL